jgi:creatinine amidohydrolase/Fe(II)-dependent formamide hydrolase-like protein
MCERATSGLIVVIAAWTWLVLAPLPASAQILRMAEMTTEDVRALDRSRTVVLLPGGILEEHGPYLPSFTDGYLNEALTRSLAEAIVAARPGWRVVVFPTIPLGNSGANDIARRYSFPGTFTVRFETLRAVFMDLADELGALGFRWVFVLHLHGAPNHSRALDDAGDYFHDTFGGHMVHLAGLSSIFSLIEGPKSPASANADGLPIHAGMDETSWLMHLRPNLVRRTHRAAPALASGAMEGVAEIAAKADWPGYFGAPALATVAHGEAIWNRLRQETARVALRILDGADPAALPRLTASMTGAIDVALDAASRAAEAERAARQSRWITAHSK